MGSNILLIALFLYVLIPCSSPRLRDQIPHPYEITDETVVKCFTMYINLYFWKIGEMNSSVQATLQTL